MTTRLLIVLAVVLALGRSAMEQRKWTESPGQFHIPVNMISPPCLTLGSNMPDRHSSSIIAIQGSCSR